MLGLQGLDLALLAWHAPGLGQGQQRPDEEPPAQGAAAEFASVRFLRKDILIFSICSDVIDAQDEICYNYVRFIKLRGG